MSCNFLYANSILIKESFTSHEIQKGELLIFEDITNQYAPKSWEELVKINTLYKPYDKSIGISKSNWWTKIVFQNHSEKNLKLYLYTDYAPLENVKLFQLKKT